MPQRAPSSVRGVRGASRGGLRSSSTSGTRPRRSGGSRRTATDHAAILATRRVRRAGCQAGSRAWSGLTMMSSARSLTADRTAAHEATADREGICSLWAPTMWTLPLCAQVGSVDKARRSPGSLITLIARGEDSQTPLLYADEAPRLSPNTVLFRIERMRMAHFGGNALAAVSTHRAERGISFGAELGSLLGDRAPSTLGAVQPVRCDYTSTSTSAPCTRTG
jgi:hypothetical protein